MLHLNADLGEGFDDVDRKIMPFIARANIACGGHAGNADSVEQTIQLAQKREVYVGAHPSYVDRAHFGRRSLDIELGELEAQLFTQISLVADRCTEVGVPLRHIKAHGALYNDSNNRPELMHLLLRLAKAFGCELMVQSLPDMRHTLSDAEQLGVTIIREGFADRAYLSSGQLAPRSEAGAVFHSLSQIIKQAKCFAQSTPINCIDNQSTLMLKIDSLCVHGDNDLALQAVTELYDALH